MTGADGIMAPVCGLDRPTTGRLGAGGDAGRRSTRLRTTGTRLSQQASKAQKETDQGRGARGGEREGSADTRGSYRDGRSIHPIVHDLIT